MSFQRWLSSKQRKIEICRFSRAEAAAPSSRALRPHPSWSKSWHPTTTSRQLILRRKCCRSITVIIPKTTTRHFSSRNAKERRRRAWFFKNTTKTTAHRQELIRWRIAHHAIITGCRQSLTWVTYSKTSSITLTQCWTTESSAFWIRRRLRIWANLRIQISSNKCFRKRISPVVWIVQGSRRLTVRNCNSFRQLLCSMLINECGQIIRQRLRLRFSSKFWWRNRNWSETGMQSLAEVWWWMDSNRIRRSSCSKKC